VNDVLEGKLLEAMTHPVPETAEHTFALSSLEPLLHFAESKTALAIGPGMSTQSETVQMVQRFLQRITLPTVVDADALNAAASLPSLWANCKAPLVLTPHPGEMARLTGLENGQAVNRDRLGAAHRLAQTHGVMVVLKGARTVLADPEGRLAICPTGNAGLATGGTGDVLTGMIAGLLAQGMPAWDAACAGTYLHGLAGDLASVSNGQAGLIAGDVIEHIPHAFEKISS
jgi:NAD(P)H-hydrate epimerase